MWPLAVVGYYGKVMKKLLLSVAMYVCLMSQVHAGISCTGVIREVNNYANSEKLYILLDSTSHYIGLDTEMAKSIALTAFATEKKVVINMSESSYSACSGGTANSSWGNLTALSGWIHLNK